MLRCKDLGAELDAYLDGELEEERAAEVARHIEECPACREALDERRGVALAVRRLPGVKAPAGFADRFRAARQAEPPIARFDAPRRRRRLAWMAGSAAAAAAALLIAAALIPGTLVAPKYLDTESETPRAAGRDAANAERKSDEALPDSVTRAKQKRHSATVENRPPAPKLPEVCEPPKTKSPGGMVPGVLPKLQPELLKPKMPAPMPVPAPQVVEPSRVAPTPGPPPPRARPVPGLSKAVGAVPKGGIRSAGKKESSVRVYFLADAPLKASKEPSESPRRDRLAWSRGLNLRRESPETARVRLARIARSLGGGQIDPSALRPKPKSETGKAGEWDAPAGGAKKLPPKVAASTGTQKSGFGIMSIDPGARKPANKPETITAKKDADDKAAAAAGVLVFYLPEDKFETFTRALAAWSGAAPDAGGKAGAEGEKKALDRLKTAKYLEATDAMSRALKLPKRKTRGGKRYVLVIVRLGEAEPPAAKTK